jgi:hypothetical protein
MEILLSLNKITKINMDREENSLVACLDDLITTGKLDELQIVLDMADEDDFRSQDLQAHEDAKFKIAKRIEELKLLEIIGCDQFSKYVCDEHTVVTMLENYGVAIIPTILDPRECEEMVNGMWEFLEHITSEMDVPIKRNIEKSWATFYDLFVLHSMLMQHWQVGHAQFVWNLRQNRKIVDVFARIWNVKPEDLLVSFDGAAFHIPPEITKRGYFRGNEWLHCDQSFTDSNFRCVQSWVTGLDVRPGDATLTFLEGSNKLHGEFARVFQIDDRADWYKLDTPQMKWFNERGCRQMNIVCPAGSLVLWDSRTIHSGKEALKVRENPNFRCVTYLCYTPRSLITEANRKKKVKALNELRLTSHWPHKVKLFPVQPRTYGKEVPRLKSIKRPILNELGLRLAGCE